MFLSTKVSSNKLTVTFWIHNVLLDLLEKNGKSYSLTYQVKGFKFLINLLGDHFYFIDNCKSKKFTKKTSGLAPFYIKRNDNQTIDLGIQITNISFLTLQNMIFTKNP